MCQIVRDGACGVSGADPASTWNKTVLLFLSSLALRDWCETQLAMGRPGCPSLLTEKHYPKYLVAWGLGNCTAREMFVLCHEEKGFGHVPSLSVSTWSPRVAGAPSP